MIASSFRDIRAPRPARSTSAPPGAGVRYGRRSGVVVSRGHIEPDQPCLVGPEVVREGLRIDWARRHRRCRKVERPPCSPDHVEPDEVVESRCRRVGDAINDDRRVQLGALGVVGVGPDVQRHD